MTIPQDTPPVAPYAEPVYTDAAVTRPTLTGRGLASAVAVFLGGYLLLAAFSGSQLSMVSMNMFGALLGRGGLNIPAAYAVLLVLQFVFAIAVVVAGLFLGGASSARRLPAAAIVVLGPLLTFLILGARISGAISFPGGEAGIPFQAVFANAWFGIVLAVGAAWLLIRGARIGWLALLATLILIPLPTAMTFANIEVGIIQIVMYAVSGIVGAAIILAGRPLRD